MFNLFKKKEKYEKPEESNGTHFRIDMLAQDFEMFRTAVIFNKDILNSKIKTLRQEIEELKKAIKPAVEEKAKESGSEFRIGDVYIHDFRGEFICCGRDRGDNVVFAPINPADEKAGLIFSGYNELNQWHKMPAEEPEPEFRIGDIFASDNYDRAIYCGKDHNTGFHLLHLSNSNIFWNLPRDDLKNWRRVE